MGAGGENTTLFAPSFVLGLIRGSRLGIHTDSQGRKPKQVSAPRVVVLVLVCPGSTLPAAQGIRVSMLRQPNYASSLPGGNGQDLTNTTLVLWVAFKSPFKICTSAASVLLVKTIRTWT